ncbi:hypothetical protein GOP47_0028118 [Adiantum capillus-veneris]|nr:hypothetical protein GOP47_0028118 [Adiantum capillus-veneris]
MTLMERSLTFMERVRVPHSKGGPFTLIPTPFDGGKRTKYQRVNDALSKALNQSTAPGGARKASGYGDSRDSLLIHCGNSASSSLSTAFTYFCLPWLRHLLVTLNFPARVLLESLQARDCSSHRSPSVEGRDQELNHNFKAVSVSFGKKSPNGTVDLKNRLSEASFKAESCVSNGFADYKAASAGPVRPMGVVANGAQHELHDTTTGTDFHNRDNRESGNDQIAECMGNHAAANDLSGEIDILAFKITEFFNAFQEGQEHNLLKFTQTLDLLSSESLIKPEGGQRDAKTNPALINQHIKSDNVVTQVDADPIDGRISSSAGRSGKWNGSFGAESFSGTLSGPLTFSGPMSFSGNSGHGPSYSGSVSHRSDSSTASTHSFAFPVLPFEFNSSPVKIAQPDKRFVQRPWKRRLRHLFCCADPSNFQSFEFLHKELEVF